MALQKSFVPINFAQGLNTKSDPKQISPGQFLSLTNSVFDKQDLMQKRNGYGQLTSLPDNSSTFVTTFNGNLTAIGDNLRAYSQATSAWVNKGSLLPADLDVLPLYRSTSNQTQCDSVVSPNGLVCTVFIDSIPVNGVLTNEYKYVIADSTTGQNIVSPTFLVPTSGVVAGAPKVFLLGNFFIVVYPVLISAAYHLQYIAVSTTSPSHVSSPANITSAYDQRTLRSFEGTVSNNNLYLAWNASDGGGAIRATFIDSTLSQHSTVVIAGKIGDVVSVAADSTNRNIYISFYEIIGTQGYVAVFDASLHVVTASTQVISSGIVLNIASVAQDGNVDLYYEVQNAYSYDSSIATNLINTVSCSQSGSVGSPRTVVRSVGLASKAFTYNGDNYFLAIYSAPVNSVSYQPTYFLINSGGQVTVKLAYSNGGNYLTSGLPSANIVGNVINIPYLVKDQIAAVNKTQGVANTQGIYSQTGINLSTITLNSTLNSAEIGANLNLSGGILWAYDGYEPTEQGFFVWPDSVEASAIADPTPTGDTVSGSPDIHNLSATTNIVVGMNVSGTGIPANSMVISINGTTITINHNATATNTATTLTFTGNVSAQQYFYQVTYEWSDNQGNVFRSAPSIPVSVTTTSGHSSIKINIPTLRLTYKIANPVQIVIYRWSVAQQTYYQITSVTDPLLNSRSVDSVTYTDIQSDTGILGNNIIYTTGAVLENIGAPACRSLSLFKSRLFLIDAEDPNLLWFSKQVIPGTPVEMSDLLTYNVAPTAGAQGSTGPNRCLAPLDDKNIVFKRDAIYYFTGTGPDNTGANNDFSEPVFITSTVGCSNQKSIVFIPAGLMFESDKGIWLLGRDLRTDYIGAPVEALTRGATVQSAVNVPGTNQVRFTMSSGITLVYDYYYGQWGTFTNVPAISSTLYQNLHTFINSFGQVYQETPGSYLDGTQPVLMGFLTGWLNLAGLQGYERAYFFYLLANYLSPHKLQISIAYDYNPSPTQQTMITPDNFTKPWGGEQLWGSGQSWGGNSNTNVENWRIFLQQQKCTAFQIGLQEFFDPSLGAPAGAGLSISGLDLIIGLKDGKPRLKASRSVG